MKFNVIHEALLKISFVNCIENPFAFKMVIAEGFFHFTNELESYFCKI